MNPYMFLDRVASIMKAAGARLKPVVMKPIEGSSGVFASLAYTWIPVLAKYSDTGLMEVRVIDNEVGKEIAGFVKLDGCPYVPLFLDDNIIVVKKGKAIRVEPRPDYIIALAVMEGDP